MDRAEFVAALERIAAMGRQDAEAALAATTLLGRIAAWFAPAVFDPAPAPMPDPVTRDPDPAPAPDPTPPPVTRVEPPATPPSGEPPRRPIGAPTMHVRAAEVELRDGRIIRTDKFGGPLTHPLSEAIRRARPGDVIGLAPGMYRGALIGWGDMNKAHTAAWPGGEVVHDVCIVSEDPSDPAVVVGISFSGNIMQPGRGGVDDFCMAGLILENTGGFGAPLMVNMGTWPGGLIRLYDSILRAGDPSAWGGYGMKWGCRSHGRARWDVRGVQFGACQEHGFYMDSLGADGRGDSWFLDIVQLLPSGRTTIQIVNRADPAMQGGPSGLGAIVMRRIVARTVAGGGGSAITVAGHLGPVLVDDLDYQGDLGAIVFWSDGGKGLHKTADGFTCPEATLRNLRVRAPSGDRPMVALSGVGVADIHEPFDLQGNQDCIHLWPSFGGPIDNGVVRLHVPAPIAAYPGWNGNARKVRRRGTTLSDAAIQAMRV